MWKWIVCIHSSPGLFSGPGTQQNTVRDKGSVNGIRDLTATRKAGFAKIWARMQDWEYSGCKRLSMHCFWSHSSLYGDPRERVLSNHTRRNTGFTSFAALDFGLRPTPKHPGWIVVDCKRNQHSNNDDRSSPGWRGGIPGNFWSGCDAGSPFLIPILLCLSDPSRIETINTFIPAFVVSSKTTPDSRPIWAKSIPFSDRNGTKTIPFGAAHTYMAYIRECPTPFGRSSGCGIIVKKVRECGSGTPFLGRPKSEASKRGWRTLPYPG